MDSELAVGAICGVDTEGLPLNVTSESRWPVTACTAYTPRCCERDETDWLNRNGDGDRCWNVDGEINIAQFDFMTRHWFVSPSHLSS